MLSKRTFKTGMILRFKRKGKAKEYVSVATVQPEEEERALVLTTQCICCSILVEWVVILDSPAMLVTQAATLKKRSAAYLSVDPYSRLYGSAFCSPIEEICNT